MVSRDFLARHLDVLLDAASFEDHGPNGLQVEGALEVRRLALGVTACRALIEKARDWGAQALLVHHGIFWGSLSSLRVERSLRDRLALLLESDLSLLAYHLPLDAHPELGNNAVLAQRLGAGALVPEFAHRGLTLGLSCDLSQGLAAEDFFARVAAVTGRDPLVVAGGPSTVRRFGVATGRTPESLARAARLGLDAFVTGEPSEPSVHLAREEGIHLVAAGHHATERFGVQALGARLEADFDLECRFFEIPNPV